MQWDSGTQCFCTRWQAQRRKAKLDTTSSTYKDRADNTESTVDWFSWLWILEQSFSGHVDFDLNSTGQVSMCMRAHISLELVFFSRDGGQRTCWPDAGQCASWIQTQVSTLDWNTRVTPSEIHSPLNAIQTALIPVNRYGHYWPDLLAARPQSENLNGCVIWLWGVQLLWSRGKHDLFVFYAWCVNIRRFTWPESGSASAFCHTRYIATSIQGSNWGKKLFWRDMCCVPKAQKIPTWYDTSYNANWLGDSETQIPALAKHADNPSCVCSHDKPNTRASRTRVCPCGIHNPNRTQVHTAQCRSFVTAVLGLVLSTCRLLRTIANITRIQCIRLGLELERFLREKFRRHKKNWCSHSLIVTYTYKAQRAKGKSVC